MAKLRKNRWKVASVLTIATIAGLTIQQMNPSESTSSSEKEEIIIRSMPLVLTPTHSITPTELSTDKLSVAWDRLAGHSSMSRWTYVLHSLRLWGRSSFLPTKDCSGKVLLEVMLDAKKTEEVFSLPIHITTRHGLEFREQDLFFRQGEQHRGQTLAVFGMIGVASDTLVRGLTRSVLVADAARAHAINLSVDQDQLEWSTTALAYYLPPQRAWRNKYGEILSFDILCERLCDKPIGEGPCKGTHVLHSIAVLLAVDKQVPVLSPLVRQRAIDRLVYASECLRNCQNDQGRWDQFGESTVNNSMVQSSDDNPAADLVITSHSLEWLAIAPEHIMIPVRSIELACSFLLDRLLKDDRASFDRYYCTYTHAANALKMWYPQIWSNYLETASKPMLP